MKKNNIKTLLQQYTPTSYLRAAKHILLQKRVNAS